MAVGFTLASSQYLLNTAPAIVAMPLTVGLWFQIAAGTLGQCPWALSDTGTTNNSIAIRIGTTEILGIGGQAGNIYNNAPLTAILVSGGWNFAVGRFISGTERRISALQMGATVFTESTVGTTARAPTGMDAMSIGAEHSSSPGVYLNGAVAEYWLAEGDIWNTGQDLPVSLIHALAFGGPFSVGHVWPKIVEYRSFRHSIGNDEDETGDVYFGRGPRQAWSAVNGPLATVPHPQLPYSYRRPRLTKRLMVA